MCSRPVPLIHDEVLFESAYLAGKVFSVHLWRADDHPGSPTHCLPSKVHFIDRLSLGNHCIYWRSKCHFLQESRASCTHDKQHWFSSEVISITKLPELFVAQHQLRNILVLLLLMHGYHTWNTTVYAFKAHQCRQKQVSKLSQEVKLLCDNKPTVRVITGRGAVLGQL